MALPAGRYGVTKNQLLKIKKLPMNTIKLIEELTEKFNLLGSAAFKNSTSVVTDSSDLVESGAVFDTIKGSVGFVTTGKNLFDGKATSKTDQYGVTWTVDPTDNNVVTVSGTPTDVEAFRQFSDKVLSTGTYKFYGLSDTTNIALNALVLYQDNTVVRVITGITEGGEFEILSSDVYNRIGIEYKRGVNGTPCSGTIRTMITKSTVTNTAYEPYHASVDESKADNSVIGTVEDGTTASQAYAVGSHFIRNGKFCTVTQAISSGGTLTEGTNYTSGNVASCLVKQATFSGTTTGNGNLVIDTKDKVIVSVHFNDSYVVFAGVYNDGTNQAIHVTGTDGIIMANAAVSGTYYYI